MGQSSSTARCVRQVYALWSQYYDLSSRFDNSFQIDIKQSHKMMNLRAYSERKLKVIY